MATPERKTIPRLFARVRDAEGQQAHHHGDEEEFLPIPGARAPDTARRAPKIEAMAEPRQVATSTAPKSSPVGFPMRSVDKTDGWTKMMRHRQERRHPGEEFGSDVSARCAARRKYRSSTGGRASPGAALSRLEPSDLVRPAGVLLPASTGDL
jgi:hypothetical protein